MWSNREDGLTDLREAGRWVGPAAGGVTVVWSVVPRKEADAWAARLTATTESVVAAGTRDARQLRGIARTGGGEERVRVVRLVALDGLEEPFAFVATAPVTAPADVDATFDLVLANVRVTPLAPAVAAATGDVPGDVIEVAALLDGAPLAGTATIERWGTELVFRDDGSWGANLGPATELPLSPEGRARFDRITGGSYDLTVRGVGVSAHRISFGNWGKEKDAHPRLVLALGSGVVRGRAFARNGLPASGATVRFRGSDGAYGPLFVTADATVDAGGAYELRGLPLSDGTVTLELPSLEGMPQAERSASVRLQAGSPAVQDLGDDQPLPSWKGACVDAAGRPVPGPGTLTFVDLHPPKGRSEWEKAIIRRDGRFAARVAPGVYRVTGLLVRPDAAPLTMEAVEVQVPESGLERDVVIGGATLVVHVRRADATVAAHVQIELEPIAATRSWSKAMETREKGEVTFSGLPVGRYRISTREGTITLPGGGPAEIEVRETSAPTEVEVVLRPAEAVPTAGGK